MLADALRSAVSAATIDAPPDGRVVDPPQWLREKLAGVPVRWQGLAEVWNTNRGLLLVYADHEPVGVDWVRNAWGRIVKVDNPAAEMAEGVRIWG